MLSKLEPTKLNRVIDLIEAAGLDVTDWGGNASNPKLCYNWSFANSNKIVLNLWFDNLTEHDGTVSQALNMRSVAAAYGQVGNKIVQRRAINMDVALQAAWRNKLHVRVIICQGEMRDVNRGSDKASNVKMKELDPNPWIVAQYDWETGSTQLVRLIEPSFDTVNYSQSVTPEDRHDNGKQVEGYALLANYLTEVTADEVHLSFKDVEAIIKRDLPPSAVEHGAWWANSRTDDSHSWAHLWLNAGWEKSRVNLSERWVEFVRANRSSTTDVRSAQTESAVGPENSWGADELRASVSAYLEMQNKQRAGEHIVKSSYYARLSREYGRSEKAFEYRMQNISYVLTLMGREWLDGLKPAKNVGKQIAAQIEEIFSNLEGNSFPPVVPFEMDVADQWKKNDVAVPTGSKKPIKTAAEVTQFVRDPKVKAWVLRAAGGACECCRKPAPFTKSDGTPFLEVHHIRSLTDGGSDTVSNAIAICPNCHRELHFGLNGKTALQSLYAEIARLVRE